MAETRGVDSRNVPPDIFGVRGDNADVSARADMEYDLALLKNLRSPWFDLQTVALSASCGKTIQT